MNNTENIIEVDNLSKHFNSFKAVDEISFTVKRGEIFGFVGPNGAGKSTSINMLVTLLTPSSGAAKINGSDIVKEREEVRNSIGIIFQDPSLDVELTGSENLYFHSMLYGIEKELFEKRSRELIKLVELEEWVNKPVKTYSGGMKRRLEIARGILHHPKVLFLDEPTIGLDPQTRSHIWNYLHQMRDKEGVTIFTTTHYLPETEKFDRVAVIDDGKIIELDTPENLKKKYNASDMDEVFIEATGHGIRDEELSATEQSKDHFKHGGAWRR